MAISLVPIVVIRELVAQLYNNPLMSGRPIYLFRHLKHQNMSICDSFIHSSEIIFFSSLFGHYRGISATCQWFHHVGEINTVVKTPWRSKSIHYFRFYRQWKNGEQFQMNGMVTKWRQSTMVCIRVWMIEQVLLVT